MDPINTENSRHFVLALASIGGKNPPVIEEKPSIVAFCLRIVFSRLISHFKIHRPVSCHELDNNVEL